MQRRRWLRLSLILALALPCPAAEPKHNRVEVEPAKTSIYVGNVTLTMTPFVREGGTYAADYKAKVVPFFFYNEQGKLWIDFSDEQLERLGKLAPGERVVFSGRAKTTKGEDRRVEGYAERADDNGGKIKVRVFVTKTIELIFNTTYRFTGE